MRDSGSSASRQLVNRIQPRRDVLQRRLEITDLTFQLGSLDLLRHRPAGVVLVGPHGSRLGGHGEPIGGALKRRHRHLLPKSFHLQRSDPLLHCVPLLGEFHLHRGELLRSMALTSGGTVEQAPRNSVPAIAAKAAKRREADEQDTTLMEKDGTPLAERQQGIGGNNRNPPGQQDGLGPAIRSHPGTTPSPHAAGISATRARSNLQERIKRPPGSSGGWRRTQPTTTPGVPNVLGS